MIEALVEGSMDDIKNELPPKEIPSAEEQSEATPTQIESITRLTQTGGIIQSPKSLAMLELEETGIRGGGMVLLRVIVMGLEEDLIRERTACRQTKKESDSWREKYYSEKEKTLVLQTQIEALIRLKILQNVFLSVGGIFAGLGVKLLFDNKETSGILFLFGGIIFLFSGWLWPTGFRNNKEKSE